ncbi:MAG: rhomboid family intramembrane serine protease [Cyclobacteriaceae bacterium]
MSITLILIIITVGISFYAWSQPAVLSGFLMNPYMVLRRGQYYRMITSGFVHGSHVHLLFNMISFYFFGSAVEVLFGYIFGNLGGLYFILLYILAIVFSDVPTLFRHQHNPGYNSLGASGGVASVIFAFILFLPLENICFYGVLCFPGFILGIVYIVYSYVQGKRSADRINHDAHLYGALFGVVYCAVLYPAALGLFLGQIGDWLF